MFKILSVITTILLFSLGTAIAMPAAKDGCGTQECAKCHSLTAKEAGELLGFAASSGLTVKSVKPAASHGLHEVLIEKNGAFAGIIFIDYGKKNFIDGTVIDIKLKKPMFAHENDIPKPKQFSGVDPKLIPAQYAVVMGNPKAVKKLYVFTDPDCPYCRTLHPELKKLEKLMSDLAINIMMYPLRQLHPQAYDKSRVVIASKKSDLLDKAFEGKELPKPKADEGKAAVDAIIKFAGDQGINGTPMILLNDGKVYQGPRTAEAMKKALEGK